MFSSNVDVANASPAKQGSCHVELTQVLTGAIPNNSRMILKNTN
jgi:hypothetical protein